ncbi:MAG: cell division protein FtsQ/DivIB [Chromatiales bacterium]
MGAFLSVGVLLMIVVAVIWLLDPLSMPLRSVRVDGEFRHLSAARLRNVVAAEAKGSFFSVNVQAIRAAVMADPWVRDVSVRRIWPDALGVTVYEQRAIAFWGENGLLNERGSVFHPPRDTFPSGLIRLSGPSGTETAVLRRYQQLQTWFRPLGLRVANVELTPRRAWSFAVDEGFRVLVGRNDFETRVRRLIATLRRFPERLRQSELIDLRYTNGFAIRPPAVAHADAANPG